MSHFYMNFKIWEVYRLADFFQSHAVLAAPFSVFLPLWPVIVSGLYIVVFPTFISTNNNI